MKRFKLAACTGKKGSSLAEMVVVLAVISIVALAVVSFTALVSAQSAVSVAKLNMAEDRQLAKVVLQGWLDRLTAANAEITVENGSIRASIDGGASYTVLWEEEGIVASVPDGAPLFCPINTLTGLRFDCMTKANGDAIYFCTVDYQLPNPAGDTIQRTFTFTLNPHIGDVYEEVGA